jgi:hypothetical protein
MKALPPLTRNLVINLDGTLVKSVILVENLSLFGCMEVEHT